MTHRVFLDVSKRVIASESATYDSSGVVKGYELRTYDYKSAGNVLAQGKVYERDLNGSYGTAVAAFEISKVTSLSQVGSTTKLILTVIGLGSNAAGALLKYTEVNLKNGSLTKEVVMDGAGKLRYIADRMSTGGLQVTVFGAEDKAALVAAGVLPQGSFVRDYNSLKVWEQAAVIAGLPEMGDKTHGINTVKIVEMQQTLAKALIQKQLQATGVPFQLDEKGNIYIQLPVGGMVMDLRVESLRLDGDQNLVMKGTLVERDGGKDKPFILLNGSGSVAYAIMPLQSLSGGKGRQLLLVQETGDQYDVLSIVPDAKDPSQIDVLATTTIDADKVRQILSNSSLVADGLYHGPNVVDAAKEGAKAAIKKFIPEISAPKADQKAPTVEKAPSQKSLQVPTPDMRDRLRMPIQKTLPGFMGVYNPWGNSSPEGRGDDLATGPIVRTSPSVIEATAGMLAADGTFNPAGKLAVEAVYAGIMGVTEGRDFMVVDSSSRQTLTSTLGSGIKSFFGSIGGALSAFGGWIASLPGKVWSGIVTAWNHFFSPAVAVKPTTVSQTETPKASATLQQLFAGPIRWRRIKPLVGKGKLGSQDPLLEEMMTVHCSYLRAQFSNPIWED